MDRTPSRYSINKRGIYRPMRTKILFVFVLTASIVCLLIAGTAHAAHQGGLHGSTLGLSPLAFFFTFLVVCFGIGILAVLGGVGGGVLFTPLMLGFTPIDSYIVRATGLFVAVCGSLVAARPFLFRNLANFKLILFTGVPYALFAMAGALLAGYVKQTAGDAGEGLLRLVLGMIVISVALLMVFSGRRVEYPEVKGVDRFTERLHLGMSYFETSVGKQVDYQVKRAPVAMILFCFVGLVSGMFGLGAGWAMVPAFNLLMLAPLKVAATTTKVLIGVGDTAAVWPYIRGGGLFPLFAVPCMIGLVAGTYIGAKVMIRIKAGFIRYLIIVIMFGSGIKLLLDGIRRLT